MKNIKITTTEHVTDIINCIDLGFEVQSTKTFFNEFNNRKNSLLNMASNDIKVIEKMLRDSRIEEEYIWNFVIETQSYGCPEWSIGWIKDPNDKYRLQFGQLILNDSKSIIEWKPLIECKAEQRLKAYEFLRYFIVGLEKLLRQKLDINVCVF